MRFDVVRLARYISIFLFTALLMNIPIVAQTAQSLPPTPRATPAESQQTPALTQTTPETDRPFRGIITVPSKPEQKASQIPDDLVIFKDPSKLPPEAVQKALQGAARQRLKLLAENSQQEGRRDRVDPGIYARQADGANVCGAIVSYNFSPGKNPQLESVTTCTPSNAVSTQRARAPKPKPAGPQVLQTAYQGQERK